MALFALFVARAPQTFDLQGALDRMAAVERRSIGAANAAIEKAKADGSDRGIAETIERDVLPPWRRSITELQGARRLPDKQARLVSRLLIYMKTRAEGWELLAEAAQKQESALVQRANEKQAEAEKLAKEIGQ